MVVGMTLRDLYHVVYRLISDETVTVSVDGLTAEIDNSTPIVQHRMTDLHETNRPVLERLIEVTDRSDTFWDVGAHVGRYSCLVGQIAGEVIAIEAHPRNVAALGRNVARNDIEATIYQFALADDVGVEDFAVQHDAAGEFLRGADIRDPSGSDTRPIPTTTGERLTETFEISKPTILRMDITGGEPDALDGMGDLLDGVRYMAVHTYPDRYQGAGAVKRRLRETGFEIESLTDRVLWGIRDG